MLTESATAIPRAGLGLSVFLVEFYKVGGIQSLGVNVPGMRVHKLALLDSSERLEEFEAAQSGSSHWIGVGNYIRDVETAMG